MAFYATSGLWTPQEEPFQNGVTDITAHMTEDDHHEEGEEEHHEEGAIFEELSGWNVYTCFFICVFIMIVAIPVNTFNIYVLGNKARSNINALTIVVSCLYNYITYIIIVPMAAAGVLNVHLVTELFCYVQEPLTLITIILRFFLPALMALCRCNTVLSPRRPFFNIWTTLLAVMSVTGLAVIICIVPLFGLKVSGQEGVVHEHGCHLWSTRVDTSLWYQLYGIGSSLVISVIIMIVCYTKIFLKARLSVNAMATHKRGHRGEEKPTNIKISSLPVDGHSGLASQVEDTARAGTSTDEPSDPRSDLTDKHKLEGQQATKKMEMHKRVGIIAFLLIMSHVIFWLPWLSINIILSLGEEDHKSVEGSGSGEAGLPLELRVTTLVVGYIPATTDPIMYALMQPEIMTALKKTKEKMFKK